jgi:hypothetical protein
MKETVMKTLRRSIPLFSDLALICALALVCTGIILPAKQAAAQAGGIWFNCNIAQVWEMGPGFDNPVASNNSFQVFCTNLNNNGFNWLGLSVGTGTDAQARANRFMSTAQAAILARRIFRVHHGNTACPGLATCNVVTSWSLGGPQP